MTGTVDSLTVALGTRDQQDEDITWGTARSRNARTFCCEYRDLDTTHMYHSMRMTITGEFDKAIGVQFDAVPGGAL